MFAHVAFAGTAGANKLDKGETLRERCVWGLGLLHGGVKAGSIRASRAKINILISCFYKNIFNKYNQLEYFCLKASKKVNRSKISAYGSP